MFGHCRPEYIERAKRAVPGDPSPVKQADNRPAICGNCGTGKVYRNGICKACAAKDRDTAERSETTVKRW